MNTQINYLYRDASNNKIHQSCVIPGEMTAEQEAALKSYLIDGEYFIPEMVGLPAEQFSDYTEDDHDWFEYQGMELTDKPVGDTEVKSPEELVSLFESAHIMDWIPLEQREAIWDRNERSLHAFSDEELEKAWEELGDICIDDDENLLDDFEPLGKDGPFWPAGTFREDTWQWFDNAHSKGVAWLMGFENEEEK